MRNSHVLVERDRAHVHPEVHALPSIHVYARQIIQVPSANSQHVLEKTRVMPLCARAMVFVPILVHNNEKN